MDFFRSFCYLDDGRFNEPLKIMTSLNKEIANDLRQFASDRDVTPSILGAQDKPYIKDVCELVITESIRKRLLQSDAEKAIYETLTIYFLLGKCPYPPIFPERCLNNFIRLIWKPMTKIQYQTWHDVSYFNQFLKAKNILVDSIPTITEEEVLRKRSKVPHARNGENIDLTKIKGFYIVANNARRKPELVDKNGSLNVQKLQNALADYMLCQPPSLSTLRPLRNYIDLVVSGQSSSTPVMIKSVTLDGLCRVAMGTSYQELVRLDPDNFAIPNPTLPMTKQSAIVTSFFGVEPLGLFQMAIGFNYEPKQLAIFNNDLISMIYEEKIAEVVRGHLERGGNVALVYHSLDGESLSEAIQQQNRGAFGELSEQIKVLVFQRLYDRLQFSGILVDIRNEAATSFISPYIQPLEKLRGALPIDRINNGDLLSHPILGGSVRQYMD